MTLITPTTYFTVVSGAAECIAQELEDHVADGTLGRPTRVLVAPGNEVPWDVGKSECSQLGMAFQHGPYLSRRFPVEDIEDPNLGCDIGATAVRVVASLVRCEYHPAPTNQGRRFPTPQQQTNAALLQSIEAHYMAMGLRCCLSTMKENNEIDDYRIQSIDRGVNGDVGEVSIVFLVQILG